MNFKSATSLRIWLFEMVLITIHYVPIMVLEISQEKYFKLQTWKPTALLPEFKAEKFYKTYSSRRSCSFSIAFKRSCSSRSLLILSSPKRRKSFRLWKTISGFIQFKNIWKCIFCTVYYWLIISECPQIYCNYKQYTLL